MKWAINKPMNAFDDVLFTSKAKHLLFVVSLFGVSFVDFWNSVSMADLLQHFSHECPLTSPDIVAKGVCNSCYTDELVDFSCDSCKFDLCKDCSKLPQIVSHDFHEHSLEFCLREYDQKPDYIICSGCGNMSSRSFYKCKECEIYLDLGCALMENIFRG